MPGSAGVDWTFNLVNGVSGPAAEMKEDVKGVEGALKHTDEAIEKGHDHTKKHTESTFGKMVEAVKGFAEGFFFVTESVKTGAEFVERAFDKLKEATEFVLDASNFRRDALLGLDAMLNTGYQADAVLDKLEGWARQSGLKKDSFVGLAQGALADFKEEELKPILAAAADVQAVNHGSEAASQAFVDLVKHAKEHGLDTRLMRQATAIGIKPELVEKAYADAQHVTVEQAKALLAAGNVKGTDAAQALVNAIHMGLDKGGPLGKLGETWAAGSIPAQVTKLSDAFTGLFERTDSTKFAETIAHITAELTGDEGERFAKAVGNAFDTVGNVISKIDFAKVGYAIDQIADGLEQATDYGIDLFKGLSEGWDDMKPAIDAMGSSIAAVFGSDSSSGSGVKEFARAVMDVVGAFVIAGEVIVGVVVGIGAAVVGLSEAFAWLMTKPGELGESFGKALRSGIEDVIGVGTQLVEGLWVGIETAWGGMLARFQGLVELLPAAVKHVLGIASPSKVFEGLGINTMQGFGAGMEAVNVQDQMTRQIGSAVAGAANDNGGGGDLGAMRTPPSASSGGAAGGGMKVEFVAQVHIDGGGKDSHALASEAVAELRRVFLPDLVAALDQLRIELGGAAAA